jgi:hypothetical protein
MAAQLRSQQLHLVYQFRDFFSLILALILNPAVMFVLAPTFRQWLATIDVLENW